MSKFQDITELFSQSTLNTFPARQQFYFKLFTSFISSVPTKVRLHAILSKPNRTRNGRFVPLGDASYSCESAIEGERHPKSQLMDRSMMLIEVYRRVNAIVARL